jgi:hypothetical protein
VKQAGDVKKLIETAKEMESNFILHATQENLPVLVLERKNKLK